MKLYKIVWINENTELQGEGTPSSDLATLLAWVKDMNEKCPNIKHDVVEVVGVVPA